MDSTENIQAALAALEWQIELGADEATVDAPVDRYALASPKPESEGDTVAAARPAVVAPDAVDPVAEAKRAAAAAQTLDDLRTAMAGYVHCDLSKGARNLVFADGMNTARVMIIGEAPGRDEDREGRPFVGRAGQLLDRMFDAIGMGRARADAPLYITNVLPWRPPHNRDPKPDEIEMMKPFLARHVELVAPDILVIMGNISCDAVLGRRGITRLRGNWTQALGRAALPMFHPAYLLRNPAAKREAWADLLALRARLDGLS